MRMIIEKVLVMKTLNKIAALTVAASFVAGCNLLPSSDSNDVSASAVLETYVSIAKANYGDSLESAKSLKKAVDALLAKPNNDTLAAAKAAWIEARVPYQQTEVYRFGNASVDDWEGKVNAWPLDEGLIDYVDAGYGTESDENPFYTANIIGNAKPTIGGKEIDASNITPALLGEALHEIDEVESNVVKG